MGEEAPEDAPALEIMPKRGFSVMSSIARRRKDGAVEEGRRNGTEMNERRAEGGDGSTRAS